MDGRIERAASRFGPTLAVVAAVVALTLATSSVGGNEAASSVVQSTGAGATAGDAGAGGDASAATTIASGSAVPGSPGGPTAGGAAPGSPGAAGAGAKVPTSLPPTPQPAVGCRADGRMAGISYYMPPCAPLFKGDNHGATARGVQRDKVIVARWRPQSNAAVTGATAAAGVGDTQADVDRTVNVLTRYFNTHYETYGRQVQLVTVDASGPSGDDQAARADVIKIAKQIGAFAVIAGGETQAFDKEAAAQGLLCINCALSAPQAFYNQTKGFVFGGYPPAELYYQHMAEYIGKRLAGRPAKWAGDPAFQATPRKFGLIWVENDPLAGGPADPNRKAGVDFYRKELAKYGVTLTKDVGYQYDLSREQEQATNAIVQLQNAGVTNVAFVGDAISPTIFTKEATRQRWFPEWFITGNLAIDNVILGREYDQAQWRHAFGIGFIPVLAETFTTSLGYLEYKEMSPGDAPANGVSTYRQPIETLFNGIHMAGPDLTPASFAAGMYRYPPAGGTFSSWLTFYTPTDPSEVKDFKEIWWDPTGTGQDEYGHAGVGVLRNVNGGKRYKLGDWPKTEPAMFDTAGTVIAKDDPFFAANRQDPNKFPPSMRCRSC
jgi:hypothetical protein